MRSSYLFAAVVGVAVLVAGGTAGDGAKLKSGPQVGELLPGAFHPLNVTGEKAGEKHCLYCEYGPAPVAMVFARTPSEQLTNLIKKLDAATAQNAKAEMGSFVVFLSNKDGLQQQLKTLAEKNNIKKTVLAIDNPAGPDEYKVAKDADVTVVLYREAKVISNFSFRAGELNNKAIDRIVSDIPKILK
jgi:hypothetical protein